MLRVSRVIESSPNLEKIMDFTAVVVTAACVPSYCPLRRIPPLRR